MRQNEGRERIKRGRKGRREKKKRQYSMRKKEREREWRGMKGNNIARKERGERSGRRSLE